MDNELTSSFVTYLANDLFLEGALKLGSSLKKYKSVYPMACVITDEVCSKSRDQLEKCGYKLHEVPWIESTRTDFKDRYKETNKLTFTKLNIFNLPYGRIVYLDADVITTRNIDELFTYEAPAAVYDNKALDVSNRGFNSGVMVLETSKEAFDDFVSQVDDYGGYTDQTLLQNKVRFNELPSTYNKLYKQQTRLDLLIMRWFPPAIIHFNGRKPWFHGGDMQWEKKLLDGAWYQYRSLTPI